MEIKLIKEKKDYYTLIIDGVEIIKKQERTIFRHILQTIDNGIDC
jgi:hypothetical protein